MLQQECTGAPKAMDLVATKRDSLDDSLLRRQVQKPRWLGLDPEEDRLAAALPESHTVGANVDFPETD